MPVTVPAHSWGLLWHAAHTVNPVRRGYIQLTTDAIQHYWSDVLPRGACNVLAWLSARTAGVGMPAAVGTLRQLLEPFVASVGVVVNPLDISLKTLRRHLHLLEDRKLVKVHEMEGDATVKQNAPRAFEIDFKVVVLHPGCTAVARRKVLLIAETVDDRISLGVPPPKSAVHTHVGARGISYIYRYEVPSHSSSGLGKPNHALSASPTGGFRGRPLTVRLQEDNLKSISLATPKKTRIAAARPDSVTEVLAGLQRKAETRAATTKAKTAAGATDKRTMQNYLNELMQEFHPTLPRLVVTDKPLAVMKKRLAAYQLADYRPLLRFAIGEWATIAQRNRQSFTKKLLAGNKVTPMAESPSFAELAYRLPYFVTIFTSGSYMPGEAPKVSNEADMLRRRVAVLEREVEGAKDRLRRTRSARPTPEPAAPAVAPRISRQPRQSTTGADWAPPAWE